MATYYVSTTGGSDVPTNGTYDNPWRTLNYSIARMVVGDQLIVRSGGYSESLPSALWNGKIGSAWGDNYCFRISNYPGETVWLIVPAGASDASPNESVLFGRWAGHQSAYIQIDGINVDWSAPYIYGIVCWKEVATGALSHHIRLKNLEVKGQANAPLKNVGTPGPSAIATAADDLEFINLRIHGGGWNDFDHGIYHSGHRGIIDGCEIWDMPGAGIQVQGHASAGELVEDNIVRNCYIRDNRRTSNQRHVGIVISYYVRRCQVYNNIIVGILKDSEVGAPAAYGLVTWDWGEYDEWYNNTVVGCDDGGMRIATNRYNVSVRNNISYDNGSSPSDNYVRESGTTALAEDHNAFDGTDPEFEDYASRDLRPTAGSPCVDAGATIVTTPPTLPIPPFDRLGVGRPQGAAWDQGAYEVGALLGADLYVDWNNGNNGYDGLSPSYPLKTWNAALTKLAAMTGHGAGKIVWGRGGYYDELIQPQAINGNVGSYLLLQNYPNETVWLQPTGPANNNVIRFTGQNGGQSYVEFDGLNLDGRYLEYGCVKGEAVASQGDPHHIRFRNCEMVNTKAPGVVVQIADFVSLQALNAHTGEWEFIDIVAHGQSVSQYVVPVPQQGFYLAMAPVLLDRVEVYDTYGAAWQITNEHGVVVSGSIVRNGYFHDIINYVPTDTYRRITPGTVFGYYARNAQVYNNIFANCGNPNAGIVRGLAVDGYAQNVTMANNLVVGIAGTGISLGGGGGLDGGLVRNNIVYNNTQNYYLAGDVYNLIEDHNFNFAANVNPLLTSEYRLESNSPCLGQGIPTGTFTTDRDGHDRGVRINANTWDQGPYEYQGTGPTVELFEGAPVVGHRVLQEHRGAPRQYRDRARLRNVSHGRTGQRR